MGWRIPSDGVKFEAMTAYLVETKHEKSARKKHELAQRLDDPRKVIASLRYYDAYLVPQKWTVLPWPPRREKSRKVNSSWSDGLTAARRVLGIVVRRARDENGKPCFMYYLGQEVWRRLQSSLDFSQYPLLRTQGPEVLYLSEEAADRMRRSQMEWGMDFSDRLSDPQLECKFKRLPAKFKMTAQLEELASDLGPLFLVRVQSYLSKDYDELAARSPERVRGLEQSRSEHLARAQAEPPRPEIFQMPTTQKELNQLYTQGLRAAVRGFMNKIRFG